MSTICSEPSRKLALRTSSTSGTLVRELHKMSPEFAGIWELHEVGTRFEDHKTLIHPDLGQIEPGLPGAVHGGPRPSGASAHRSATSRTIRETQDARRARTTAVQTPEAIVERIALNDVMMLDLQTYASGSNGSLEVRLSFDAPSGNPLRLVVPTTAKSLTGDGRRFMCGDRFR